MTQQDQLDIKNNRLAIKHLILGSRISLINISELGLTEEELSLIRDIKYKYEILVELLKKEVNT